MLRSADYSRRAEECRKKAEQCHDAWSRDALLRTAGEWERLAEERAKVEDDTKRLARKWLWDGERRSRGARL